MLNNTNVLYVPWASENVSNVSFPTALPLSQGVNLLISVFCLTRLNKQKLVSQQHIRWWVPIPPLQIGQKELADMLKLEKSKNKKKKQEQ